MRYRTLYLRVGIVVVVVALVALGYLAYTSTKAQRRNALTVTERIPAGRALTPDMLSTVQVPADAPDVYLTSPAEAVGKVAQVELLPGVPIARGAAGGLLPSGRLLPSGLSVPEGMLALAVPVDVLGSVGGILRSGDAVSVLAPEPLPVITETEAPAEVRTPQAVTYTVILTGVQVVDLRDAAGKSLVAGEAGNRAAYAVLLLSPEQAVKLARYREVVIFALEGK